jgi:5-methylcytosine-specific restriction endonuclease McrA
MHLSSTDLLLIVIIVLIIGLALLQRTNRRRRHHRTNYTPASRRRRSISGVLKREIDHGARIAQQHGLVRSPEWHRVEKEHLLRQPACAACGYRGRKVQVHHIKPFHLHPQLELDPSNLITLCAARGREHHLLLGHLDEWESYNEHVRADVKRFYRKSAAQIRADVAWQKKMAQRP